MSFTRLFLYVALATSSASAVYGLPHNATALRARGPSSDKKVIAQMFEWNWDSLAQECTDFLGPAGYGYVQVSPPQEHITDIGNIWASDYQPVSYKLQSKRGDRDQFQNMISKCHDAGVGVIADAVINHMTAYDGGKGSAGTTFSGHYTYPDLYSNDDFHHCGLTEGDEITTQMDKAIVETCEMGNLADLATETEYVRKTLAAYLNDLVSLGVDGFRIDAAKYIDTDDINNILSRVDGDPYVSQEVVYGEGEPNQPDDYTQNGDVQEFRFPFTMVTKFQDGSMSDLNDLESWGFVSSDQANVFISNHDTERTQSTFYYKSPNNLYITSTVFMLAFPYGTPTVHSGYDWTDKNAGAPNDGAGECSDDGGSNGWTCQHRYTAFAGMVKFRNTVGDAKLTNWQTPSGNQIAFGRGTDGFVVINNIDGDWSDTLETSLPDGEYCDVVASSDCSSTVTVSGGSVKINVSGRSALAIHTAAKA